MMYMYTLEYDTKCFAVAYANIVRHICTELPVKKKKQIKPDYKLSLAQHEEIVIASL